MTAMSVVFVTLTIATLIAVIAVLLYSHNKAASTWADERAYLTNVVVAKHGQDLRAMMIPAPDHPVTTQETRWQDALEGYDAPVGMQMPTEAELRALAAEWIAVGEAARAKGGMGQVVASARIGCAQALLALLPDED